MSTVEVYLTGDQIATYDSVSTSGKGNGTKVTLDGVETLGTSEDIYRVVVTQVDSGEDAFSSGQLVEIYAYPNTDPPSPPIYSSLEPQDDQFEGRASSAGHQIFTQPANIVIDVDGFEYTSPGTVQYGPGLNPPRSEQLPFDAFPSTPPDILCFAAGTLIEGETGPIAIECLRAGDLVQTLDNGLQPISWIGGRMVEGTGHLAPIVIEAGALGNHRRLVVSPQHRMLVTDWRAEVCFGDPQVLVAACHLVNGTTIRQVPQPRITWHHMIFERHEIVFAEGIPSESLFLGAMALSTLTEVARAEVFAIFPDLAGAEATSSITARRCLRAWESTLVAPRAA